MQAQSKITIVTGGSRGIGRAITRNLSARGYAVAVFDRDQAPDDPVATDTGPITFHRCDVADESRLRSAVGEVLDRHGRIDALINNAGIMIRKPLAELTLVEWSRVIATNLTAAFIATRACADALRDSGGAVVNIASTRALMSEADTEAYAASKGGLVALSHALAISLGPRVRVNCVSPGWIDTKGEPLSDADHRQHPAGRVGRPEDVAELVAYLISPAAAFVTGANFVIDGGMTRKMIYTE